MEEEPEGETLVGSGREALRPPSSLVPYFVPFFWLKEMFLCLAKSG